MELKERIARIKALTIQGDEAVIKLKALPKENKTEAWKLIEFIENSVEELEGLSPSIPQDRARVYQAIAKLKKEWSEENEQ